MEWKEYNLGQMSQDKAALKRTLHTSSPMSCIMIKSHGILPGRKWDGHPTGRHVIEPVSYLLAGQVQIQMRKRLLKAGDSVRPFALACHTCIGWEVPALLWPQEGLEEAPSCPSQKEAGSTEEAGGMGQPP